MTADSSQSSSANAPDHAPLGQQVVRAVDFRGDVTIVTTDGRTISGYAFDATLEPLDRACIRLLPIDSDARVTLALTNIASLSFTGKDAASGRTWENWLRRYATKKLAGESASIESEPL